MLTGKPKRNILKKNKTFRNSVCQDRGRKRKTRKKTSKTDTVMMAATRNGFIITSKTKSFATILAQKITNVKVKVDISGKLIYNL